MEDTIVGIDLGTTNSEIAVVIDGRPVVLGDDGDDPILPSMVGLDPMGKLLVGKSARNQYSLAPDRTIRSVKRLMGQDTKVKLGDVEYTPQEVSALILRSLKERAEKRLKKPVTKAVITVPAFFNEVQRQATREAGTLAGLDVVRIINEPTAATLAYEPGHDRAETVVVYDLGGGTFDVSVVRIEGGVVEVLASNGDVHLGGDDFDLRLLDRVCGNFISQYEVDPRATAVGRSRLLSAVERVKKELSFHSVAELAEEFIAEKNGEPLHLKRELEREEYEELIRPLLDRTLMCLDKALADAMVTADKIDQVLLVGGVTRTPAIQALLESRLGIRPRTDMEPDLCVAMGAAVQGAMIAGQNVGPVLVDITPHSLGISALGPLHGEMSVHCYSPIIRANSTLPVSRTETYTTASDYQEVVEIKVFQGEDPDARHNEKVGEFKIEGLQQVPVGNQVLVRFDLDLNGILTVTAIERATGLNKRVTIESGMARFRKLGRQQAEKRLQSVWDNREESPDSLLEDLLEEESAEFDAADDGEDFADDLVADRTDDAVAPAKLAGAATARHDVLTEANRLLGRAAMVLARANPEDAGDLRDKMSSLGDAVSKADERKVKALMPALDDLVFYLEDA